MTRQEIREQIRLSQTVLKDYLLCPKLFEYRHLERLEPKTRSAKALNGSAIHLLMYWLHHGEWDMDVANMYMKAFGHYEFAGDESHIPIRWQKDRDTDLNVFISAAIEMIDGYRNREENQKSRILYQEVPFRVKIRGELFEGVIDAIRQLPDGKIELLDFKTNAMRPNEHAVKADVQINLYSFGCRWGEFKVGGEWISPHILPDYSSIYYLPAHKIRKRNGPQGEKGQEMGYPLIRTTKTIQDLRAFREEVSNILKSMLKPWHFRNNSTACVFCQYTEECQSQNGLVSNMLAGKARDLVSEIMD